MFLAFKNFKPNITLDCLFLSTRRALVWLHLFKGGIYKKKVKRKSNKSKKN